MKHKKLKLTIIFTLILAVLFLTSYGFFYVTTNQSDRNRLAGGCFNPTFTDGDSISITNALPMTNKEGLETDPYHFTLTNSCTTKVKYYVILNVKNNSFDEKYINVSLNGGESQRLDTVPPNTLSGTIDSGYTNSYLLKTGMLEQGSITENIRAWLNDSTTYDQIEQESNSGFTAQIKVVGQVGSEYNLATTKIMDLVNGEPTNTTDVITKEAPAGATCTNTLAYDGTSDNNLRYVGANPCNYVSFNNELWRIIGVMNNIDDGTGVTETRIKLIRGSSLGNYSWDTSASGVNVGYGINDWTGADLKNELNGDYLNTSLNANTKWYNGSYNGQSATFYYRSRLSAEAQELIGDAKWYLGGFTYSEADEIPSTMYTKERGTTVWGGASGQTCNDGACPRATSWTGKVALIYPSDYGYATAGGTTTNRSACIGTLTTYGGNLYGEAWRNSNYSDCKNSDWLKPSSYNWLLSPGSNLARYAFYVDNSGVVHSYNTYNSYAVLPAVYLGSGVTISSGSGTESDPYILS